MHVGMQSLRHVTAYLEQEGTYASNLSAAGDRLEDQMSGLTTAIYPC